MHTEQTHWVSHNEISVFLGRPFYNISQCKRVLLGAKAALTRAAPVDIICVDVALSGRAMGAASESAGRSQGGTTPVAADAPTPLHNIGNTCFMNALLQCCRQLIARIPSSLLPASSQCPLAEALLDVSSVRELYRRWRCWSCLAVGPQRDACEVFEQFLGPKSPLHNSCDARECYGLILRDATALRIGCSTECDRCPNTVGDTQPHSILRAAPQTNTETSIAASLQASEVRTFLCEACG